MKRLIAAATIGLGSIVAVPVLAAAPAGAEPLVLPHLGQFLPGICCDGGQSLPGGPDWCCAIIGPSPALSRLIAPNSLLHR